ncbi:MAG: hypothetical protein ACI9W4_002454, partial [Rhodothermales bacterium]
TVRWLDLPSGAGVNRVSWDLRMPAPDPVNLVPPGFVTPWSGAPQGPMVAPGRYSAQLVVLDSDGARTVGDEASFNLKALFPGDHAATMASQADARELIRRIEVANSELGEFSNRIRHMRAALLLAPGADAAVFQQVDALEGALTSLRTSLSGDRVRGQLNETSSPSIRSRVNRAVGSMFGTTQAPTQTQLHGLELGRAAFDSFKNQVGAFRTQMGAAEAALESAGAPWTPGRSNKS